VAGTVFYLKYYVMWGKLMTEHSFIFSLISTQCYVKNMLKCNKIIFCWIYAGSQNECAYLYNNMLINKQSDESIVFNQSNG